MTPLPNALPDHASMVDVLTELAAAEDPARAEPLFRFLSYATRTDDDQPSVATWTASELHRRARALACAIAAHARPGERVLIVSPTPADFVEAFFACLYAGAVAVPVYPPAGARRASGVARLLSIFEDSEARVVVTTAALVEQVGSIPGLAGAHALAQDRVSPALADDWRRPPIEARSLALFQYTSGSTGAPKGVVLDHGNLVANLALASHGLGLRRGDGIVCWLPLFHDLGLSIVLLAPFVAGCATVLPPEAFLARPIRWLEAITRYRAAYSGAPNFAFELCLARVKDEALAALDLSSLRMITNAAEPVRVETVRRFTERFAPVGLGAEVVHAGYGLAEATVFVSCTRRGSLEARTIRLDSDALGAGEVVEVGAEPTDGVTALVSIGRPSPGAEVRIVDPERAVPTAPGRVGEIWVRGPQIGSAYWRREEESRRTFGHAIEGVDGSGWLRTGDLGFVRDGELFITGRLKDLIILRGRNHYPQDIERTVERAHRGVRPGCAAAFAVEVDGGEQLGVAIEVRDGGTDAEQAALLDAIRAAVAEHHGLRIAELWLLSARSLPKTSSGKIQRRACRRALEKGELSVLHHERAARTAPSAETPSVAPGPTLPTLRRALADHTGTPVADIHVDRTFSELGLDSVDLVELAETLGDALGVALDPTRFFDHPTVGALATALDAMATVAREPRTQALPAGRQSEPVAIVGAGCRLPGGADDLASLFGLIDGGVVATAEVPASRWRGPGHGGFLDQVDRFDAGFFGVSAREAEAMDPQQRILLEVAWEALEDAGQRADTLRGSRTGVFAGACSVDYASRTMRSGEPSRVTAHAGTGAFTSVIAGRLAYTFGLRGPALTVDTACSSSLVALHLACRSLADGECNLAIACGVNVMLAPDGHRFFEAVGALAADGRCKPFDASADGYVRAEGCAVVILKPLAHAVRDGDRVLGVVRGSSVNQDGRSNGITAPHGPAQQDCLLEARARAGLGPDDVDYVEAHGTGTRLGDPVELDALTASFAGRTRPLHVGSVKAHLGHTEAAAGLAGLLKVLAMLEREVIPAQVGFDTPNPLIDFARLPLHVPTRALPWARGSRTRRAGISSFGLSGTNAHVIVEEAPARAARAVADATPALVPVSARSPEALRALALAYADALDGDSAPPLRDLAYAAGCRRSHHGFRAAVVAIDAEDAARKLRAIAESASREVDRPRVALVFPGQGGQWPGMGAALAHLPAFARAIEACETAFAPLVDWSLAETLRAPADDHAWHRIDVVQPMLFAMEVALAALLRAYGVMPDAVIGHSMGEIAAAHVAGALTLDDAARIICTRSQMMRQLSGAGAMAVLEVSPEEAEAWLQPYADQASLAVCNGPRTVVVSGRPDAVDALLARAEREDRFGARVKVDVASHSPQMDALQEPLVAALASLSPRNAHTPMFSTVDAAFIDGGALDASYWMRNLREPVRFDRAVDQVAALGRTVFVEVSPHPVLGPSIAEVLEHGGHEGEWVASLRRPGGEPGEHEAETHLLRALGTLYTAGAELRFASIQRPGGPVRLPRYPFQRERYWLDEVAPSTPRASEACGWLGPLHESALGGSVADVHLDAPYLEGHAVEGTTVVPAAGYVEMAWALGDALRGAPGAHEVLELTLDAPLVPRAGHDVQLAAGPVDRDLVRFQVASRGPDDAAFVVHATGIVRLGPVRDAAPRDAAPAATPDGARVVRLARDEAYRALGAAGLDYRDAFRRIEEVYADADRARGRLDARDLPLAAALDGCLQVSAFAGLDDNAQLPVGIRRVVRFGPLTGQLHVVAWREGQERFVEARDESGRLLLRLEGLRLGALHAPSEETATKRAARAETRVRWIPRALDGRPHRRARRWLVVGPSPDAVKIAERLRARAEDVRAVPSLTGPVVDRDAVVFVPDEATLTTPAGVRAAVGALADLTRRLVDAPLPLFAVTRLADAVRGDDVVTPGASALAAFGAVVANEHPELACVRLDVDTLSASLDALVDELLAFDPAASALEDRVAFREGARHVARLGTETPADEAALSLRADARYLVTGGLGALGLALARDLVARGARHLVLVSRRGPDDDARRAAVEALRAKGAVVECPLVDLGAASASRALARLRDEGPAVRGVVHAAGVLHDATVLQQRDDAVARVFEPKVDGAAALDATFPDLDFLVLCSSAAGVLGSPGQGAYAAANGYLDGLALLRRARGRAATSVRFGPLRGAGLAEARSRADRLASRGVHGVDLEDAPAIVAAAIASGATLRTPITLDVARWRDFYPHAARQRFLGEGDATRAARGALLHALDDVDPRAAERMVERWLEEQVGLILGRPNERISTIRGLTDLGMDSLMAVELRNRIERALDLRVSPTVVWKHPTIKRLAAHLAERVRPRASGLVPRRTEAVPPRDTGTEAVPSSDEELLEAIRREIA